MYRLTTFDTRKEARDWLIENGFKAKRLENVPGLWSNPDALFPLVRAFMNMAGGWSVLSYTLGDPNDFICE